jgi:hypothetical protein
MVRLHFVQYWRDPGIMLRAIRSVLKRAQLLLPPDEAEDAAPGVRPFRFAVLADAWLS